MGDNLKRIQAFAKANDIALKVGDGTTLPYPEKSFDLVMLNDVLEHMPMSPRLLVNAAVSLLKPNGVLMVTVPNAVNIRKRMDVLRGRTNLPPFNQYYWSDGLWRGHIREYVKEDLVELARYSGLQVEKLESCHHMLGVLPAWAHPVYKAVTNVFPGWRDSWILVACRPARWVPQTGMALARHYGVETVPDFVK
jgi:SAM-dependent methyltransferase